VEKETVEVIDKTSWMRGTSPLKGALLGLLIERPGHGYELASRLGGRLGPAWRIEPQRIYRLLDQLERAGLASSVVQSSPGSSRQQRTVYHPTGRAPEALTLWMETLLPKEPVRVELHAKIAVAREEDLPRLLVALKRYERECLELLQVTSLTGAAVRSWMGLIMDLTRDAVDAQLRAEIEWARRARQRIREYGAQNS